MRLDPTYLHKVGKKLTWDDKEKSKNKQIIIAENINVIHGDTCISKTGILYYNHIKLQGKSIFL